MWTGGGGGGGRTGRFLLQLDRSVAANLRHARLRTRPGAGNGLWCCALLPACLAAVCARYPVTPVFLLAMFVSLGLLIFSVLFLVFASISMEALKERCYGGTFASGLACTLLCFTFLDYGLASSFAICVPCVSIYNQSLRFVLNAMPGCFTIGEAMLVLQGCMLFALASLINIANATVEAPKTDLQIVSLIVQSGLVTVALMIVIMYFLRNVKDARLILCGLCVPPFTLLIYLHVVLGKSSLLWVLEYITSDDSRMQLIGTWFLSVGMAAMSVYYQTNEGHKASTSSRKFFHLLAVMVFLPGILIDPTLLTLAAGVAFALLILLEAIRVSKIEPISTVLQEAFDIYADEKDVGGFSLTPIYLFVGISSPLMLMPFHEGRELDLMSGVLSIGIGDSAASWFGSRYGRHKWKGLQRTIEGTTMNALSQFAAVYLLQYIDFLQGESLLLRGAMAAVVSSAVESYTDQVDNLVLPFITLLTLTLIIWWQ